MRGFLSRKPSLTTWIFVGLGAGVLFGLLAPQSAPPVSAAELI